LLLPHFCAYFSLQTLQFLLEGTQTYFLSRGAGYPSYATGTVIGAGSRGAAALLEIFWPPLPENCILSHFFFIEHLLLGQERGLNPAKTFFFENAYFWEKSGLIPVKTFVLAFPILAFSVFPPCPKIVPAPLETVIYRLALTVYSNV